MAAEPIKGEGPAPSEPVSQDHQNARNEGGVQVNGVNHDARRSTVEIETGKHTTIYNITGRRVNIYQSYPRRHSKQGRRRSGSHSRLLLRRRLSSLASSPSPDNRSLDGLDQRGATSGLRPLEPQTAGSSGSSDSGIGTGGSDGTPTMSAKEQNAP